MRHLLLNSLLTIMLIAGCLSANAQQSDEHLSTAYDSIVRISGISIIGNKKTRAYIILREMRFATGDTVHKSSINDRIQQSRQLIYNTNLFNSVEIDAEYTGDNEMHLTVTVIERWYIYPVPLFKLSDRNLNEWLNTHHADFDRVIYGARFTHYNLSGRRDKLEINLMNGYARNISFQYSSPYSNPQLTEGFSAKLSYTENREISFKTSADNKLQFVQTDGFIQNNYTVAGTYSRRKGYYRTHTFGVGYVFTGVKDTVLSPQVNPDYFNSSRAYHNYPELSYSFQYLDVNNLNYPLRGEAGKFSILKRGLEWRGGMNDLELNGSYNLYFDLKKGWYASTAMAAKIVLPFKLAYQNQRALGYMDYNLRGLDYYVIDGPVSGLLKNTLKKHLLSFKFPSPIAKSIIPYIPFTFYAKAYGDLGYVHQVYQYQTHLANRMLYTYGIGLDLVTLYDLTLQLDYSFNQLNENGLFLQLKFTY